MRGPRPDSGIAGLVVRGCADLSGKAATNVVVTIKPVHALVFQVMQGIGAPALLVKGASSPHGYASTPVGAKALSQAMLFRVSAATRADYAKAPRRAVERR